MLLFGGDYEHTLDVGAVPGEIPIEYRIVSRPELFARVLQRQTFDACEFSLSNYIMMRDRGENWLTAVPVFSVRAFRHGTIIVRKDDPIESFAELVGRRVGVPDYTMTAAVWCRGILHDEFGVHWSDLKWFAGPEPRIAPPKRAAVTFLDSDLEDALAAGWLDALILPSARDNLLPDAQRRFRPLLRDWRAAEQDYFTRSGIFPISHVVVIDREALATAPSMPASLWTAYAQAMAQAKQRRLSATFLPWGTDMWNRTMEMFGHDPLPYGLGPQNTRVIEKLQDYLLEQGLIESRQTPSTLFVHCHDGARAG